MLQNEVEETKKEVATLAEMRTDAEELGEFSHRLLVNDIRDTA
jgi:hypothetical protein